MSETRAVGMWRQLSAFIVLAIFGCALALGSGCPAPPPEEKPSEGTADAGPKDEGTKDEGTKDEGTKDEVIKDEVIKDDGTTDSTPDKVATVGSGAVTEAVATAKNQYTPLDASPSPDGKLVYFTAFKKPENNPDEPGMIGSSEGALFKMSADGTGTPTELVGGFMNPTGLVVSKDGSTVYVADSGMVKSEDDGVDDPAAALQGAIYSVPAAGGSKTEVSGTKGYRPKSMDIVSDPGDQIYFSGVDPNNNDKPGIFRVSGGGGNVNVESTDDKIQDPGGIAVAADGTVYVAETIGGSGGNSSSIYKISNGTLTEFVSGIKVGYPAGIALSQDEQFLLVSGIEPAEKSAQVYRVAIADGTFTTYNKDISDNSDSAGLHRAHNCDLFAWANASTPTLDDQGNPQGGGTVYMVKTKAANCK